MVTLIKKSKANGRRTRVLICAKCGAQFTTSAANALYCEKHRSNRGGGAERRVGAKYVSMCSVCPFFEDCAWRIHDPNYWPFCFPLDGNDRPNQRHRLWVERIGELENEGNEEWIG